MKVFLTGATGFIGARVVDVLLRDDHEITALVRTDKGAAALQSKGLTVAKGDLTSYDIIGREATKADAVIHTAFIHGDFDKYLEAVEVDRRVSEVIVQALKGSNKPFIATCGAGLLGDTPEPADESYPVPADHPLAQRAANEQLVITGAKEGVRSAVIRLPLYVYDSTGSIFSWVQEQKAQELGHSIYLDDGDYAASAVHVDDVAELYLLVVKHTKAGELYHATSGSATGKQIAEAIATKHKLEAKSIPRAELDKVYGSILGAFFSMQNLNDSQKARRELGWQPKSDSSLFLDSLAGRVS